MNESKQSNQENVITFDEYRNIVLNDYRIAWISRNASLSGRREVLTGKAKFGIFGDGKEVAQIAMAKAFKKGDWRAGYYRDQTFMMALGLLTVEEFFAQLYAHTDVNAEPSSAGRSMNGHYASRILDDKGEWLPQKSRFNVSSDISPTAAQMPRSLGLALASKIYRNEPLLSNFDNFTLSGNEVAFVSIGDASTSEGHFWETINAAGVLQVPLAVSVWDDGYGISVPKKYQTTKESISEILKGFEKEDNTNGIKIFTAKGWNYAELVDVYEQSIEICRKEHIPILVHVQELTQPQGHSTSGSHERYKTKERLEWEQEFDCLHQMRKWLLKNALATENELDELESQAKEIVKEAKSKAWKNYLDPLLETKSQAIRLLKEEGVGSAEVMGLVSNLEQINEPNKKDIVTTLRKSLNILATRHQASKDLLGFLDDIFEKSKDEYNSFLHSESKRNALKIRRVDPSFSENSFTLDGREILRNNFQHLFEKYPNLVAFGEDLGNIGDVNQGFEGLQKKFGEHRIFDTGIRECTIIGQAIGLALRGLRPIAEIQYLDYIFYGLQMLTDDLATLQYRTKGGQKAPAIIRTRGHRLEGIWHSGSPMGSIINSVRGMYVCVPRNMVIAAGMYNLLLQSDEPAIVVEPLNGYRLKERQPDNLGDFTVPLGMPELLSEGSDLTLVTYGSCVRIAQDALQQISSFNISVELIDIQTLLPFDLEKTISKSVRKTNRLIVLDEDVPGGASAFILQQIVQEQDVWNYLDAAPLTITAKPHRPAYGTDGDYFSKPNAEDIVEAVLRIVNE